MGKLKIKDRRGINKVREGQLNAERVVRYFLRFPKASRKDCADALGLSYGTVCRHLRGVTGKRRGTKKCVTG